MGTKAFLQKGRTKPGIVLPANAVKRVNDANDRSALIRAAERNQAFAQHMADPLPNIGDSIAAKYRPEPETECEPDRTVSLKSHVAMGMAAAPPKEPPTVGMSSGAMPEVIPAPPEPAPEDTQPDPTGPGTPNPDDLTVLPGVGRALEKRLRTYGYDSLAAIAQADPTTLDQVPGSKNRGASWVEAAKELVG